MDWIPNELPPHVHIIISLNPIDEKGVKLNNYIKKHFGKNNTINIEPFMLQKQAEIDENLIRNFVETSISNRYQETLSENLVDALTCYLKEIHERSLSTLNPLFCNILLKYLDHSLSYRTFYNLSLEPLDVNSELYHSLEFKNILERFYTFLERKHGDVFVKRTLGYIAAYQFCGGCTENELIDLLSLDDAVLSSVSTDLFTYKCVPEFYWLALKSILFDFDFLLEVHNSGGYRCLVFKHSIFYETVNDRYFQQRDKATSYFKTIVNYYLNKHGSVNTMQAMKQPMEQMVALNGKKIKTANIRRLDLLAYHLSQSGPSNEIVKDELMFNYLFLKAKLTYAGYECLIDDFKLMLGLNSDFSLALQADSEVKLFLEFLNLSEAAFRMAPEQLYSQLMGRMTPILAAAVGEVKAPGCEIKPENQFNFLKKLMNESKKCVELTDNYCFLPNSSFMLQPDSITCEFLNGFLSNISTVATTQDGKKLVTFEMDGVCKLWDLHSRKLMKTFYKIKDMAKQVS